MATTTAKVVVRTSEPPKLHVVPRFREVAGARQILWNLIRKEVKVKYKSSVLGVAWSMLNPILYLGVFSVVFGLVVPNGTPHFAIYLLSGLLAWNLFSTSLGVGARSVIDNANLVTKVYFPRELLPLSSVGTALVDTGFQAIVLVFFMVFMRVFEFGVNWLLLPLALVALVTFTSAMAMFVSALNVRYRDTQYLLSIILLVWFWMTPVVYPSSRIIGKEIFGIPAWKVFLLNPMADIVFAFQRVFYGQVTATTTTNGVTTTIPVLIPVSVGFLAVLLTCVTIGSIVLLWLAWRSYFLMSGDFAEEL
jgi:ABC-type polysaccharide/polyol phosphate export permease